MEREVAVKVLGNEVAFIQQRIGDCVVFLACNQAVNLFVAQHTDDGAGLIDGIAQAIDLALVAVVVDDALATLDQHEQHKQGGHSAWHR